MEPTFDEDKWNDIVAQWEADDNADAADQLASDKDAYDLAQPKTWAAQDLANAPMVGTSGMNAPPDDSTAVLKPKPGPLPSLPAESKPSTTPPLVDGRGVQAAGGQDPALSPDKMNWTQLEGALRNAQLRSMQTRAASNMFENVAPGYRPDMSWGDMQVALAKQPLELAKEKQNMEGRRLTMDAQRRAAGVKDAMDNPNSMQSQKAREAFKGFFGNGVLPSGFDNWSANDVQKWIGSANMARKAHADEADRAAKTQAAQGEVARKAAAAQEKADAEKGALENSRKGFERELRSLGIDPANASQKDIDRAIELKKYQGSHEIAQSNNAIARAGEQRKVGDYEALGADIPFAGEQLKFSGSGKPRAEDVNEVQKISGLYGAAIRGMNDLEGAMGRFAQHPSVEARDEVIAKTQAVSGHLNTALGQGAMSKDEKAEMAKSLGVDLTTPGGIAVFIDKLTGDDKAAAAAMTRRIKAVRDSTRASALGKMEPYHFGPGPKAKSEQSDEPEETRVINGRTYRRKGDKWVTDA